MAYKDRDEALDDFFDHIFGDDDVSDEDRSWFEDKIVAWFDKAEGVKPPGRRRQQAGQTPAAPRRVRPGRSPTASGSDKSQGGYGLGLLFGGKEDSA